MLPTKLVKHHTSNICSSTPTIAFADGPMLNIVQSTPVKPIHALPPQQQPYHASAGPIHSSAFISPINPTFSSGALSHQTLYPVVKSSAIQHSFAAEPKASNE